MANIDKSSRVFDNEAFRIEFIEEVIARKKERVSSAISTDDFSIPEMESVARIFDSYNEPVYKVKMSGPTTKCCATGTCDSIGQNMGANDRYCS